MCRDTPLVPYDDRSHAEVRFPVAYPAIQERHRLLYQSVSEFPAGVIRLRGQAPVERAECFTRLAYAVCLQVTLAVPMRRVGVSQTAFRHARGDSGVVYFAVLAGIDTSESPAFLAVRVRGVAMLALKLLATLNIHLEGFPRVRRVLAGIAHGIPRGIRNLHAEVTLGHLLV